jgi:saccharopine dehydrogenase-like NADP-dependent oxidoreductase
MADKKPVLVLGLGKVGSLTARMLSETGFKVTAAARSRHNLAGLETISLDAGKPDELAGAMEGHWAVVSCLPYHSNLAVASAAHERGVHYFDLTEDVTTTKAIMEMSGNAKAVMAPQCGLAPGFIAMAGAALAEDFEEIRNIRLRVGALPQHPTGLLGYAFNWSPEGVVNEYLNDCEVIEDGVRKWVSALSWHESLVIYGQRLEAFTTSGGLGTMCDTYLGRVRNLDYKTIRYPGHHRLMNFFFHELLMREDRQKAGEILVNAKPPVNQDVVYVHVSVEGIRQGIMIRDEFVKAYYPLEIAGEPWRAISWTTAAGVCGVVEMVAGGVLAQKGFIKQEEISLEEFLKTKHGRLYDGPYRGEE